ncbi:PH domain-containing protein [Paenibacillus periandrae]|uniref:PH domain-containing protein n=1 Tax=Paenibacillus periandrae TaxID=1761741 RepID=UPI001F09E751|nr:PH domain-containing protein [Paenibacillus periandrae]
MKTSESIHNGKRLHPLTALLSSMGLIKEALIPVVVLLTTWFFRGEGTSGAGYWRIIVIAAIIVCMLGFGILSWLRYRYEVSDGQLKVEQGIWVTKRQFIPIERIQTIDLTEGLLHRIFRVTRVQVQTAGGNKPEVVFSAVTRKEAHHLREQLRAHKTDAQDAGIAESNSPEAGQGGNLEPTKPVVDAQKPMYKSSLGSLFIAGMSSGSMGLAIALVLALMSKVDEIFPHLKVFQMVVDLFEFAAIPLIVAAGLLIAWILGVCLSIIKFANFTIIRSGDELVISRGLLERRQVTLPLARIQAIRIVEDLLWQPFGFAAIHVESVGNGNDKGETTLLFPLLRRTEIERFLQQMAPSFTMQSSQAFEALPNKAWRSYVLPWTVIFAIVTGVTVWFTNWGWLGLVLGLGSALIGYRSFKDAGSMLTNDMLVLRMRRLALTTVRVPRNRIQSCRMERGPLERRWGLATIGISVASRLAGAQFELYGLPVSKCSAIMKWYRPNRK